MVDPRLAVDVMATPILPGFAFEGAFNVAGFLTSPVFPIIRLLLFSAVNCPLGSATKKSVLPFKSKLPDVNRKKYSPCG